MLIETKRCQASRIRIADIDEVKQLYLNPEVRRYLGGVRDEESLAPMIEAVKVAEGQLPYWVVREKMTQEFMGTVSLDVHHEGVHTEVSYQFMPKWWGAGYASEIVRAVITYAFEEMNLPVILAETQTANLASCKMLEKIGMKLERKLVRFGAQQSLYALESCRQKENPRILYK